MDWATQIPILRVHLLKQITCYGSLHFPINVRDIFHKTCTQGFTELQSNLFRRGYVFGLSFSLLKTWLHAPKPYDTLQARIHPKKHNSVPFIQCFQGKSYYWPCKYSMEPCDSHKSCQHLACSMQHTKQKVQYEEITSVASTATLTEKVL